VTASPTRLLEAEFAALVCDVKAAERERCVDGLPDPRWLRSDILAVLSFHEQQMRRALNVAALPPAYDSAVWDAFWQLRIDILAAPSGQCTMRGGRVTTETGFTAEIKEIADRHPMPEHDYDGRRY
jgi:hypothetical protein